MERRLKQFDVDAMHFNQLLRRMPIPHHPDHDHDPVQFFVSSLSDIDISQ
jgi:hypothetical protein